MDPQPRAPLRQDPHIGSRVVPKTPPSPHSRGAKDTEGQRTTSPVPSLGDRESHHNRNRWGAGPQLQRSSRHSEAGPTHHVGIPEGLVSAVSRSGLSGCQGSRSPGSGCPNLLRVTLPALSPWAPGRRQTPATLVTPTQSPPSCPPLKQIPLIGPGFRLLSHE